LDNVGRGTAIQQIPLAWVEQENMGVDSGGRNLTDNEFTSWGINIPDGGANTYTLNLVGVSTGATEISISALFKGTPKVPKIWSKKEILIASGQTKKIQVLFDPDNRSLTSTSIVNGGDFLKDTQAACGLGAIGPPEACQVLEALASEVESAETKGDAKAEKMGLGIYLAVLSRLHSWGHEGSRKDWDDFKGQSACGPFFRRGWDGIQVFANDPAYAALKLDVQTLLNTLPGDSRHHKAGGDKVSDDKS